MRHVILDNGHGKETPGKRSPIWGDGSQLFEWEFTGTFENRDSLLVAETVKYKRFLGFLWKTSKVKDRKVDVVSKNPHTKILGVEFTTIRE